MMMMIIIMIITKNNNNYNNNNNNTAATTTTTTDTEWRNSKILRSRAPLNICNMYAQVARAQSRANHVQHIGCL